MLKKALPNEYHTIVYSYLALVIANLIWAAAGPVIKLTISYMPPFTFLFLRFLLVCLLILPYTVVELTKVKIKKDDIWKVFVLGLFSQSSIIFVVFGLKYTTSVDAAIIGSIGVLLSMAAGHYFFNEKMNEGVKAGVVLALLGTFLVIIEPLVTGGLVENTIPIGTRIWGNILVFLNNIAFLLYIIWSKISFGQSTSIIKKTLHFIHLRPMKSHYPASLLTAISFYVGMFSMLPFALFENIGTFGPVSYDLLALDSKALMGLVYMALLSSITAYFLFEWALNAVSVGDTAIIGYLSSIFGIPFAFIIMGEVPTTFGLIGASVIGIGIVIAEVAAHYHKKHMTILQKIKMAEKMVV